MNVGVQAQPVVTDAELGLLRTDAEEAAALAFAAQLDALLEVSGIDRMTERHGGDDFLCHGIGWVLIELHFADIRFETRGVETCAVALKCNMLGNEAALEAHGELRADRPVGLRRELQSAVVHPQPGAFDLR